MSEIGDIAPGILCLGIDALICGAIYLVYKNSSQIEKALSEAPEINIDENLKLTIQNHPSAVVNHEDGTVSLPYAVIRGNVTPLGKSVISSYTPEPLQGVIQKVVFREHKKVFKEAKKDEEKGSWVDKTKIIHQYINDVPFCLINYREQSEFSFSIPHIEIVDWKNTSKIDIDTVHNKYETSQPNLAELAGLVMGDLTKGVQKTEKMLTNGTTLTGVGQLVLGPMGVQLMPPSNGKPYLLVKDSISSIIKDYEGSKNGSKIVLDIFVGIGILAASWMAWKYYKKLQE